ncbi:MAG: hypothetical protein WA949_04150 [Phormidesmis sp.]
MSDRASTYKYTEMQSAQTYRKPVEEDLQHTHPFLTFVITFVVSGIGLVMYLRTRKKEKDQRNRINENAKAIERNNKLLREQIQLQTEVLEALRRKAG